MSRNKTYLFWLGALSLPEKAYLLNSHWALNLPNGCLPPYPNPTLYVIKE